MKIFFNPRQIALGLTLFIVPFAINAQDTQKEVHIKIIENGVVTKDTVYYSTDKSHYINELIETEVNYGGESKKHKMEKHVIVMHDGDERNVGHVGDKERQKDVRVVVKNGPENMAHGMNCCPGHCCAKSCKMEKSRHKKAHIKKVVIIESSDDDITREKVTE